ncbi:MAG TPA: D-2-hydroxyacid dehydrogenase family protein [Streptosporangiaceae bacterium]|jgi:phosphoglycerate dehydrogenase-like enzyme
MTLRIVALDDYQGLVERLGLAERLAGELQGAGLDGELAGFELVAVREHLAGAALADALAGAQVVVAMRERTRFDRALLSALPDLRLLVTTGMRNASIDLAAADDQGVTVCGTEGPQSANTAEIAWGLILSVLRHIPEEHAAVQAGGWQRTVGRDLLGTRLGLVGLGRIGHQMARIAAGFEMDVVAWSQHLDPAVAAAAGVTAVTKDELFETADVVSVHLVLSDRSRGLIGAPELRLMQSSAILVNTSRGPIIDKAALLTALDEGWIAGAGLDVYDAEPMAADDPLRTAPRTVLTPHLGYVTDRTMDYWYDEIAQGIAAWQRGEPVRVITGEVH